MAALEWTPEIYPATGGLAAAGFYQLLGRPRLDPLTVLVRETAQNSWDARASDVGPVQFRIDGRELMADERRVLAQSVFTDSENVQGVELNQRLTGEELTGIFISDRKTKGLGGPLRADQQDPDGIYDWVDFVLNVGKANTQGMTGGTYGFGKTICYVVSSVNSIVIHSRTQHRGRPQSRLIACAIGDEFRRKRRLCTGRHWWGKPNEGGPEPLTGARADQLASKIGMPDFGEDECGTNILIISPDLGGRSLEQAMTFIAESMTWHLWPKMIRSRGKRSMELSVSCRDNDVVVPQPRDRPPLDGFADAFRVLRDGSDEQGPESVALIDEIKAQRPKTDIGMLVTVPKPKRRRRDIDDGHRADDPESPASAASITGPAHHVALLRGPDLVVDYMEVPSPVDTHIDWTAVFKSHDEHDGSFAQSEPPTHDSWQPELMPKGTDKTIVNVALREIRQALDRHLRPASKPEDDDVTSTARVANKLAHLVRSTQGKGPGRAGGGGGGSGTAGAMVRLESSRPVMKSDQIYTLVTATVTPKTSSRLTLLSLSVGAALDGSSSDPALDPDLSLVSASWNGSETELSGQEAVLNIAGGEKTTVEILISRGAGTSVLVAADCEAGDVR